MGRAGLKYYLLGQKWPQGGGVRSESRERGEVWSSKTQLIEDRKDKILTNFDNLQDLIKDNLYWINNTIAIHT